METTKNFELTEIQAMALEAALRTETSRLDDFSDRYADHPEAEKLLASAERCRRDNEYLRGRVAGLLEQWRK